MAGLGHWPKAANLEFFKKEHGGRIPLGILRTIVPAAPDAWIKTLSNFGTMSFADVASTAIKYAREGFTVHPTMANFLWRYRENYKIWPSNQAIWQRDGQPLKEGDLLVQTDLSKAYSIWWMKKLQLHLKADKLDYKPLAMPFIKGISLIKFFSFTKKMGAF